MSCFAHVGMIRVMTRLAQQVIQLGGEIRYSTNVETCQQPRPQRWRVTSAPTARPLESITEDYDKLIVATGTFSKPSIPSFAETYMQARRTPVADLHGLLAIHTSHLSDNSVQEALYARPRRIAIIGGSKSALDAAERLASVSSLWQCSNRRKLSITSAGWSTSIAHLAESTLVRCLSLHSIHTKAKTLFLGQYCCAIRRHSKRQVSQLCSQCRNTGKSLWKAC